MTYTLEKRNRKENTYWHKKNKADKGVDSP